MEYKMTPEQFVYWLQGFSETNGETPPTLEQWKIIQDHLQLVFTKITPNRPIPCTINITDPPSDRETIWC